MPVFSSEVVSNIEYSNALIPSGEPFLSSYGYGFEISEDGNTIVAGDTSYNSGSGAVYVFSRQGVGGSWNQIQTITWSLQTASSSFGSSVALSGDGNTLVVGSLSNSVNASHGKAQVYTRNASTLLYSESQTITVSTTLPNSAAQLYISSDGSTIVFASQNESASASTIYVYTKPSTTWTQQTTIASAIYATLGQNLSTSGDGNTLAFYRNENNVVVYFRSGSTYTSQSTRTAVSSTFGIGFNPISLSYDGNALAISDSQNDRVFYATRSGSTWSAIRTYTSTVPGSGGFGYSLALSYDGSTLFIYDEFGTATLSGVTYVAPIVVYSTTSATLLYVYPTYYDGPEGFYTYSFSSFKCSVNGGTIVGSTGSNTMYAFDTGRYLDNNFYGHNGRNDVWTVSRFGELSAPKLIQNTSSLVSSFTFTVPVGAKAVNVLCIGGGGGGGGGARNSAATSGGGAGGGGGAISEYMFSAAALGGPGASIAVSLGAGGAGGAATASGTTALAGNNGVAGGTTTFGSFLKAFGGPGGLGGQSSGGTQSGSSQASTAGMWVGATGAGSSSYNSTASLAGAGGGGGGGGGASSSATLGSMPSTINLTFTAAGTDGAINPFSSNSPGVGGGGAAQSATTPTVAGNGSDYGAGGGGGGEGSSAGATGAGGAGGSGAAGQCHITVWYG